MVTRHKRMGLTGEQWLWFCKRIVTPACQDIRGSYPLPNVMLWIYLQGMYDAMQALEDKSNG